MWWIHLDQHIKKYKDSVFHIEVQPIFSVSRRCDNGIWMWGHINVEVLKCATLCTSAQRNTKMAIKNLISENQIFTYGHYQKKLDRIITNKYSYNGNLILGICCCCIVHKTQVYEHTKWDLSSTEPCAVWFSWIIFLSHFLAPILKKRLKINKIRNHPFPHMLETSLQKIHAKEVQIKEKVDQVLFICLLPSYHLLFWSTILYNPFRDCWHYFHTPQV